MSDLSLPPDRPVGKPRQTGASHLRTITALVLREMESRYGRTPGGYLWALLEPLGMIVMLSIGFALLLKSPPLGTSFLLFYATGQLLFSLFLRTTNNVMNALKYSGALLRYPAVTWIDAVFARFILNVLTDLLVAYVLLTAILSIVDNRALLDFGPILLSFALASVLGLGVGMMNCVIVSFIPMWQNIWAILTRPLFLASGVIWLYEDLPQLAQEILWYNPLVHILGMSRSGYFGTYDPQYVSVPFVLGLALGLIAMGLLLLRRYHLWILNNK